MNKTKLLGLLTIILGAVIAPFLFNNAYAEQAVSTQSIQIFDSHSHYSFIDGQTYSPKQIEQKLKQNHIIGALISSRPTKMTEMLHVKQDVPIVPFLALYQSRQDKASWMHKTDTIDYVKSNLARYPYQGIGEMHIFKQDVDSPVLKQIVQIAQQQKLKLMIHGDAEIIDKAFQIAPDITIIWAHLGTEPCTGFLSYMLNKHPNLYVDTSVRDHLFIDPESGWIKQTWQDFFIKHQERVLVAIDTYSTQRWTRLDQVMKNIRTWLNQLPKPVAEKLAYQNAIELFEN